MISSQVLYGVVNIVVFHEDGKENHGNPPQTLN